MKRYEVWAEGCLDQGMEGVPQPAVFIGYGMGESFVEAASECIKRVWGESDWKRFFRIDENNIPSAYVRLYDNETDARKAFG